MLVQELLKANNVPKASEQYREKKNKRKDILSREMVRRENIYHIMLILIVMSYSEARVFS